MVENQSRLHAVKTPTGRTLTDSPGFRNFFANPYCSRPVQGWVYTLNELEDWGPSDHWLNRSYSGYNVIHSSKIVLPTVNLGPPEKNRTVHRAW